MTSLTPLLWRHYPRYYDVTTLATMTSSLYYDVTTLATMTSSLYYDVTTLATMTSSLYYAVTTLVTMTSLHSLLLRPPSTMTSLPSLLWRHYTRYYDVLPLLCRQQPSYPNLTYPHNPYVYPVPLLQLLTLSCSTALFYTSLLYISTTSDFVALNNLSLFVPFQPYTHTPYPGCKVFFNACNSVKYHGELLNYIDIPCLDIHGKQVSSTMTSLPPLLWRH